MSRTTVKKGNAKAETGHAGAASKGTRTKEIRKDDVCPDSSVLSSKGLSAMIAAANHHNIDFLELAIISGTVLRGIIGKNVALKIGQNVEVVPSANVLLSMDAKPQMRALERFTSSVGLLQDRLIQNQSLISGRPLLDSQGPTRSNRTLQDDQSGCFKPAWSQAVLLPNLRNDLVPEVAQHESIHYPRVMTTGVSMELLKEEIETCHQCHCLLINPRIDDAQADRRTLDKLETVIRGHSTLDQRRQNKAKRPVDRLHAQIIGQVRTDWLQQVAELEHPVLEEFILLEQTKGSYGETDFSHLDEFKRVFQEILVKLLDMRLRLQIHQVVLRDPVACEAYMKMEAAYQTACDQLSQEPGRGVRGIPKLLLWTMKLYLAHFDPALSELELAKWVYSAASTLVNRHMGVMLRVRKMAAVESKMKIADRIIEIIEGEGPMKAWELRRRFNEQSKCDHDPLLRAMQEIGCLASKDQKIGLGKLQYEQARPLLVDQVLLEMSADTFPDVSALPNKKPSPKIRETSTANTAKKRRRAA